MKAKMGIYYETDLGKLGCEDANDFRLHEFHNELSGSITGNFFAKCKATNYSRKELTHTHKKKLEETHKYKAQKKLLLTQSSSRMCVKCKTSFLPRFKASTTNINTEETITKTISL